MLRGLLKMFFKSEVQSRKPIYAEDLIWNREVYSHYLITRNSFRFCMQNGLLSRQDILNFKAKLNSCIKNKKRYQYRKFENDAHEIYSKLLDTSISKKQMIKLNAELQPYISANHSAEYKTVGHLVVIK